MKHQTVAQAEDALASAKLALLTAESALHTARQRVIGAEIDLRVAEIHDARTAAVEAARETSAA